VKHKLLKALMVLHSVSMALAQTTWLENDRGLVSMESTTEVPVELSAWFYSLSPDLQQQWQEQIVAQLASDCHRIKAPEQGDLAGFQVSRHGLQWFDDFTGQSHRLLTKRMQMAIGQLQDAAMPWTAWDQGAFRQMIWQDLTAGTWRSLRLAQGQLQQLNWQQSLSGVREGFLAVTPSRSAWFGRSVILVPAATEYGLQLIDTNSGELLLSQDGEADIANWPTALDSDGDALWDRFYQVDRQGRVWRLTVKGQVISKQTVADFSASGWQFDGALNAVRAQWPAADGGWYQGDVLIIAARANPYGVIVLPLVDGQSGQTRWQDLHNADESASGIGRGWYLPLGSVPVANSHVMAGVLYLPLHYAEQSCAGDNTADQLLALHLFKGTAAYQQRFLPIDRPVVANWQLQRQGDQLSLKFDGVAVIPTLQQISARCDGCMTSIELPRFNRWQPLGVFPAEQGAY